MFRIRIGNVRFGDIVSSALAAVGITEERVTAWVGAPCGCKERKEKLNRLGFWAQAMLGGTIDEGEAEKHIEDMLSEPGAGAFVGPPKPPEELPPGSIQLGKERRR